MLIKDQNNSIPERTEIEEILKECLFKVNSLGAQIRAINFTLHCKIRYSSCDLMPKSKSLIYDDLELEAPIANTVTFIVRQD